MLQADQSDLIAYFESKGADVMIRPPKETPCVECLMCRITMMNIAEELHEIFNCDWPSVN